MMKLYTKHGDRGTTSLLNGIRVSKFDDRIECIGTIDEANSYIGLAKTLSDLKLKEELSQIQKNLMVIMSGIADTRNPDYRFDSQYTKDLERAIDEIESSFPRTKDFVLHGRCELSARLDVARSIIRRAERRFHKVERYYGADANAVQYLNRLSDYLYILARYEDFKAEHKKETKIQDAVVKNILNQL